jgi:hypothetical protein
VFDHASAIGKWGPIFLELIELHEVTPELESRFYTGGASGSNIAPIAYIVDDPAAESERLEAAGMPKFVHLRQGPIQISLHDAPLLGHAIEVHENTDAINGLFALFAAGAAGWDGSEPLREMPEGVRVLLCMESESGVHHRHGCRSSRKAEAPHSLGCELIAILRDDVASERRGRQAAFRELPARRLCGGGSLPCP